MNAFPVSWPCLIFKSFIRLVIPTFLSAMCFYGCKRPPKETASSLDTAQVAGEYTAELTHAPKVPRPVTSYWKPEKVIVNMEAIEDTIRLADGVRYAAWTFNGTVPGPFIRVNEGDLVEIHLSNAPGDKMPHNLDIHAVSGPEGGAGASLTLPGHTSVFRFRALHSGLFVYHCATPPVAVHIANGMYGLIMVEPHGGLPRVDKEFYLMESEFYTTGKSGDTGVQEFDLKKAEEGQPDYVVFNGAVGSTTGEKALHAKVGDHIRIFVGNAGPDRVSSFHIIGVVFDTVYAEGGSLINTNVGVTLIPAAGTAIVDFTCLSPGTYNIIDHSMFLAMNKGALAQLIVTGKENKNIFSGKVRDEPFNPVNSNVAVLPENNMANTPEKTFSVRLQEGKALFNVNCAVCHQANGEGIPNTFPPLAKSDFLMSRQDMGIGIVLHGLNGEKITVNGKHYHGVMPQLPLTDDQIASILTYVRNSWGNKSKIVNAKDVARLRGQ